jgi:hypothetical protein
VVAGDRDLTMWSIEGEYAVGYTKFAAEWTRERFAAGASRDTAATWFLQGTQTLSPRWFVAARHEGTSAPPFGGAATRGPRLTFKTVEAAVGFRVSPELTVRGSLFASKFYTRPSTISRPASRSSGRDVGGRLATKPAGASHAQNVAPQKCLRFRCVAVAGVRRRSTDVRANRRCTLRHAPGASLSGQRLLVGPRDQPGPIVEMKTRRTYFLDYPCDLKPGEKVTFILSLHGAGSYGNWQRHYFPIVDYKEAHSPGDRDTQLADARLVGGRRRVSAEHRDVRGGPDRPRQHQGILAGGAFARRTDIQPDHSHRVLQEHRRWLAESLRWTTWWKPGPRDFRDRAALYCSGPRERGTGRARCAARRCKPARSSLRDFSFIFATGEREMDEKGLPSASEWAAKYGCGPKGAAQDIVDTKAGYIYDRSRQNPPNPAWGLLPRPGKARSSPTQTAGTAASSLTSCDWRRATLKGSSRTSPKRWSS